MPAGNKTNGSDRKGAGQVIRGETSQRGRSSFVRGSVPQDEKKKSPKKATRAKGGELAAFVTGDIISRGTRSERSKRTQSGDSGGHICPGQGSAAIGQGWGKHPFSPRVHESKITELAPLTIHGRSGPLMSLSRQGKLLDGRKNWPILQANKNPGRTGDYPRGKKTLSRQRKGW